MVPVLILVAGLVLFLGVHLVPALPSLRAALAARWGEQRYRGLFSLVSLVGLALVIGGYVMAPPGPRLFPPSPGAIAIAPYAVSLSLILFAAANMRGHARRVVKHPLLLSVAIWAAVHLMANGDTRGTVLFASFLAYAAFDFFSVVQRQAIRTFQPALRNDAIAVVAGIAASLALMALHRPLFGVAVVRWGF